MKSKFWTLLPATGTPLRNESITREELGVPSLDSSQLNAPTKKELAGSIRRCHDARSMCRSYSPIG